MPSALSHLIRWIESFQFHAGVGGGEPPVDFREGLVSLFFPSGDLLRQERLAFKASVQALTREDTQLRLRHVQPTAVFGRVVALKPRRQGEGGRGIECFIQAGDALRVEVVHHQHQDGGFRVDEQQQVTHEPGPVASRPLVGDLHGSFARQRLNRHENVGRAATLVFTIVLGDVARTRRERIADLGDQLLAALVHADHGSAGIVWAMGHFQHVFHCRHEFGRGPRGQAPAFLQPRLEFVFFSVRRTVS